MPKRSAPAPRGRTGKSQEGVRSRRALRGRKSHEMGPSNPSGRRSETKTQLYWLARPKLARKIRFSFGVQDLRGTIGVDAAAPAFDLEARQHCLAGRGSARPAPCRSRRGCRAHRSAGRGRRRGRAARRSAPGPPRSRAQMRGAGREVGVVQVVGLDAGLDEGAHQRLERLRHRR